MLVQVVIALFMHFSWAGPLIALITMPASLVELGRRKYCSVNALSQILNDIRSHGLPDATSASSIKRARNHEFSEYETPYGQVVRSIVIGEDAKGEPCTFWYADARACLFFFLRECPKLADFVRRRLFAKPCSFVRGQLHVCELLKK